ncbi:MAG: 4-vinyl reductase [archaeon]
MSDMIGKLMLMRQLRFGDGKIDLFNQNILITPSFLVTELTHEMKDEPTLYEIGRRTGFEWFKTMVKDFRLKEQDIVKWGFTNLTMGGWGKFIIKEVQVLGKRSHTILEESTIAKEYVKKYGKSDFPVDNFVRGLMAGGACIIHNHPTMEMIETKCMAMGERCCEIIAKPREELDLKNPFVAKQIGKKAEPLKFQ